MTCYLCKLSIPHNEAEHNEVLEGALKAIHSGNYPGMTNGFRDSKFPVEADVRMANSNMSFDECIQAYMKNGKTRRIATQYAKLRMKKQAQLAKQPQEDGKMNIEQFEALTLRGKQVIRLVAEGLTNKGIAQKLNISEKTVKAHVTDMMQRVGVKTRTQAAIAYLTLKQTGVLEDGSKDAGEGGEAGQTIEGPSEGCITISEDALRAIGNLPAV